MFTALVIIGGMCEIAEHYGGIADKMCVCVCVKDKRDIQLGVGGRLLDLREDRREPYRLQKHHRCGTKGSLLS